MEALAPSSRRWPGRLALAAVLLAVAVPVAADGPPGDPSGEAGPSSPEGGVARAEDSSDAPPSEDSKPGEKRDRPRIPDIVEKVVVSATTAEERRDAVPLTDVPKEEIAARNRGQDLALILADTPNAYAYSDAGNGIGYSYFSLRGFRQERVATYIDGIPLNTPEDHAVYYIDLADFAGGLQNLQVQRGTGTALYGSPAVGGVVNLETAHLQTVEGGELKLGAGSYGTWRADLRYGGPLAGGRWAWMVRAAHVASDGYRRPSWTRHSLVHVALERYGVESVLRIHVFGGPENTQLAYAGVPIEYLRGGITGSADTDRRVNLLQPGETDTFFQPRLQVLHDWRIADGLFLKNSAYVILNDGYFMQFSDRFDGYASRYDSLGQPAEYVPVLDAWRKRWIGGEQVGWVPRLTWDHGGGTFTAGLFTQFHTNHHQGTIREGRLCVGPDPADPCAVTEDVGSPVTLYDYRDEKRTASAFVREALRPRPDLVVNVELQATYHRFTMGDDRVRDLEWDASYSFLSPRLGVNWNATDRWNVFGSLSTANSEPTFVNVWDQEDPTADPHVSFRAYDPTGRLYSDPIARPEKLRDLEGGFGYTAGSVRLQVGAYRMDFRDEFVPQGGLSQDGLPITTNAGQSLHRGIELQASGRLPGTVDVGGYLAWSRDVLEDFKVYGTGPSGEPVTVDYSGNRIAGFPESSARVCVSRLFGPVRLFLGARRVGTIYLDNSQDERKNPSARLVEGYVPKKIDPYSLLDLRAEVDLSRWAGSGSRSLRLEVWVDNLLDHRYAAMGYSYPNEDFTAFYTEFFPGVPRSAYAGLTFGF